MRREREIRLVWALTHVLRLLHKKGKKRGRVLREEGKEEKESFERRERRNGKELVSMSLSFPSNKSESVTREFLRTKLGIF